MLWIYRVALSGRALGRVGYGRRPTPQVFHVFFYVINEGVELGQFYCHTSLFICHPPLVALMYSCHLFDLMVLN